MFLGTYYHRLDQKKRITLPAKVKSKVGDVVVVNKGFDGCLELRTTEAFSEYSEKLNYFSTTQSDNRTVMRQVFANAAELQVDSAGRILIPSNLLEEANLEKEVVFIGVGKHLEIWDVDAYKKFKKETDPEFETIAERLQHQNGK